MSQTKQKSRTGQKRAKPGDESGSPATKKVKTQKPASSGGDNANDKELKPRAADTGYDESIATRDPALLSDLIVQRIQKQSSSTNLTSLEQSDLGVPSSAFRDTTSFEGPHVAGTLASFLTTYAGPSESLKEARSTTASPHTAVVVAAGMRVADLYRALTVFNAPESRVGKLITKHMKLAEMTKYLSETKVGIIITTPKRLGDLIEAGALDLDALRRIVIDGSYQNEKKQTLLDIKETFVQTLDLLNLQSLKERLGVGQGKIELLMF